MFTTEYGNFSEDFSGVKIFVIKNVELEYKIKIRVFVEILHFTFNFLHYEKCLQFDRKSSIFTMK